MISLATSPDLAAVQSALDCVRPLVRGHGGDAHIVNVADGVVHVAFEGACAACPNIAMTFVGPVRTALMAVEGVVAVESANVHAGGRSLARMARLLGAHPYPA